MDEKPQAAASVNGDTDGEPMWLRTAKRSWPVAILIVIAAIFGGIKDVSEGLDSLLVALHLRADALDLAQDTARGQFSDSLTRTAWKRLFWTRRYVTAIELKLSDKDVAEIWKGYMGTVEEWNENLMVNIVGLRHYYGDEKGIAFESGIVPLVNSIHSCLLKVRYPGAYPTNELCDFPVSLKFPPNIQSISREIGTLNSQLYCFVNGLNDKREVCHVVLSDSGHQDSNDNEGNTR